MPTVSCPACSTRQTVEASATGYTCTSCSAIWEFVVCSTCGSHYHSRPGSTGWTCPNCGTPHGSAVAGGTAAATAPASGEGPEAQGSAPVSVRGDDLDAAPSEQLGGPQTPYGADEPGSAFPMPQRERRAGVPPWAWVAGAAVVVAVLSLVFILNLGGEDPGDATPPANAAAATATLCQDVQQLTQLLRDDSLGRTQTTLKQDVAALKQAGDPETAKQVRTLITAIGDLRSALRSQDDAQKNEATAAMLAAMDALPC